MKNLAAMKPAIPGPFLSMVLGRRSPPFFANVRAVGILRLRPKEQDTAEHGSFAVSLAFAQLLILHSMHQTMAIAAGLI